MTEQTTGDRQLVVAEGVGRDYSGVPALDDFDLVMDHGQVSVLVGHNGSGKTTAMSIIAGRIEPSRGSVRIAGVDVFGHDGSVAVRAAVSFVPDAPALYGDLTVSDHLDLVGLAHGVENAEERSDALLERFGLLSRRHLLPRELSRGMRQKTQISCALLRPFAVLMLDEPVAGLDPPSRRTLWSLLTEAKEEGASVLFSTHQLAFAEGLADRVVVLHDGRVAADGAYEEVSTSEVVADLGLV